MNLSERKGNTGNKMVKVEVDISTEAMGDLEAIAHLNRVKPISIVQRYILEGLRGDMENNVMYDLPGYLDRDDGIGIRPHGAKRN
jgi:hypothetical protein